jgi:hypothetical protein
MDKRQLHHLWTKVRWIKPWYFLVLAIVSAVICVFALRANNQHMIELRDAVYSADKNNTDVQAPLKALQAYVTSHMNTNLSAGKTAVYPPIQLKFTYDRLVQAQGQKQDQSALYSQAQAYCEAQNHSDFSGHNRVPCIEQYVQSHGGTSTPATNIPDALYKFAFVTPVWSPDLAGWSMVVAGLSGLLFIVTFAASRWIRRQSR